MHILRKGSTGTFAAGPFVDSIDGCTLEAALAIKKANVKWSVNGAAKVAAHADQGTADAGAAYDADGCYLVNYDATDTAAACSAQVTICMTGALPRVEYVTVLPEAVYDAVLATGSMPIDESAVVTAMQDEGTSLAAILAVTNQFHFTGDDVNATSTNMVTEPPTAVQIRTEMEKAGQYLATVKATTDQITFTTGNVNANVSTIATDAVNSDALASTAADEVAQAVEDLTLGDGGTDYCIQINDSNANPVEGARVQLYTDSLRTAEGPRWITDTLGQITFSLTDGATYYYTASKAGVHVKEGSFTV